MVDWIVNVTSAEVLNILKTSTWIASGLVGIVVLLRIFYLFIDFKSKTKEQKAKDFLGVIGALCTIGIFWCVFFIWGEPLAAGFN